MAQPIPTSPAESVRSKPSVSPSVSPPQPLSEGASLSPVPGLQASQANATNLQTPASSTNVNQVVQQARNANAGMKRAAKLKIDRHISKTRNAIGATASTWLASSLAQTSPHTARVAERGYSSAFQPMYGKMSTKITLQIAKQGVKPKANYSVQRIFPENVHCKMLCGVHVLDDIQTGTSDAVNANATLQDDGLMQRFKATDTYNRMKKSDFREKLVSESSVRGVSAAVIITETAENKDDGVKLQAPRTKKEMLESTVKSIDKMVQTVDKKSDDLCYVVREQTKVQEDDVENRKMLREKQMEALSSQETDRKINRLILLRDQDIISEEKFKKRVAELSGI